MRITIQAGYSTDIHLFVNGQLDAVGASTVGTRAEVKVALGGRDNTVVGSIPILKSHVHNDTSQNLAVFDAVADPTDSTIVIFSFTVASPAVIGETYYRIAYDDGNASNYSDVIFRITVHTSLTRYWLGNKRMTLFNDLNSDRGSLVVYGECVDGTSGLTV